MTGQILGHYRILQKIGAGGMGEVYRARDEHLDRDVAIKLLPAGSLADEKWRKRFEREAKTLAKLNHPHIAAVYDFDHQGGVAFLVMEYVSGGSLAEKLKAEVPREEEICRLGEQVAAALEEAHEHGIVHRDLKPGNIMLTPEGQAKVLDFGLAMLVQSAEVDATTQSFAEAPGVVGTLPYMAPEQLLGKTIDARSDLYSFGVVLYEMATGSRPFEQKLPIALVHAILHQRPPVLHTFNPRISSGLENIIMKSLEKARENRYQSAKDLRVDLRRLATGAWIDTRKAPTQPKSQRKRPTGRKRVRSLAVLPLANLSRDPQQDFFADGMTEALISDLSKVGALKVISRTSAMHYKETDKLLPQIAEELNVDAVVEGSVLRVGGRVRITAQLIHAATDTPLWGESYERDFRDVLVLQNEVARAIAGEIKVKVTPKERLRLTAAKTIHPEAHEAYLKGRFHFYKGELDIAMGYFQLALEKDLMCALAYAGIAYIWMARGERGALPPSEAFPQAKAAALKALELDDTLAEVHEVLANLKLGYEWDWEGAEREFRQAIALNPNFADAHLFYGDFLIAMGRSNAGLAEDQRALELDPFSFFVQCYYGWQLMYLKRYDEAILQLRETLHREPDSPAVHLGLWGAFWQKNLYKEALAEAQSYHMLLGYGKVAEILSPSSARSDYQGAMGLAAEALAARSKQDHIPRIRIARLYAHAGEKDQALDWLEKAYDEREPPLYRLSVVWDWNNLRSEPRFQELLLNMYFPQ